MVLEKKQVQGYLFNDRSKDEKGNLREGVYIEELKTDERGIPEELFESKIRKYNRMTRDIFDDLVEKFISRRNG